MRHLLLILSIALITSCSNQEAGRPALSATGGGAGAAASPASGGAGELPGHPMVIREATVSIEVESCAEAIADLRRLADEAGGSVARSEDRHDASIGRRSATVVLRVPSSRFNEALGQIGEVAGEVESRSVTATDVTEEYVDVTARLRAKRALEQRYLQLLAGAEGTIEALEVERALAEVIEQIERVEARRRVLEDRVELATITVNLSESSSIFDPLLRAFSWGLDAVVGLLAFLIVAAMGLSPLIVLGAAATLIGRAVIRRRARRRATREDSPQKPLSTTSRASGWSSPQ